MSLFGLRPEEPAAIRIREAATRGTLSHALLLTGSGDRMSAACFAAAALECTGEESRPCGVCPACRKVLAGIHPDVITVRDPDHKNIAVDVVRAIRADAYIRPNEGRRKVYVFPDCALLTEQDQNVLLKVVEEGPPYAAFLFCAENAAVVLQTLRSRCVELKLHPAAEGGGEEVQAAEALCRCLAARKRGKVTELAVRLEKKRIDPGGPVRPAGAEPGPVRGGAAAAIWTGTGGKLPGNRPNSREKLDKIPNHAHNRAVTEVSRGVHGTTWEPAMCWAPSRWKLDGASFDRSYQRPLSRRAVKITISIQTATR